MIRYRFEFENGESVEFEVDPERGNIETPLVDPPRHWAALEFHQCDECPLSTDTHPHCPAALDLQVIAERFSDKLSFQRVKVTVESPERTVFKECDVQTGLRSLIGLVLAVSDCPVLGRFRAMGLHHLPFASTRETLTRTVGFYYMRQYFIHREGGDPDWDLSELNDFINRVLAVNMRLKSRLGAASARDANLNAISSLFFSAISMQCSLKRNLEDLKPHFATE